jgi:hypothetical protein
MKNKRGSPRLPTQKQDSTGRGAGQDRRSYGQEPAAGGPRRQARDHAGATGEEEAMTLRRRAPEIARHPSGRHDLAHPWFRAAVTGRRCRMWPGRASGMKTTRRPLSQPCFLQALAVSPVQLRGSGRLFCAATVTDCDSSCCSKQVASDSKGEFDGRALLCQGPGP